MEIKHDSNKYELTGIYEILESKLHEFLTNFERNK